MPRAGGIGAETLPQKETGICQFVPLQSTGALSFHLCVPLLWANHHSLA